MASSSNSNTTQVISIDQENGLRSSLLLDLGRERLLYHLNKYLPSKPVDLYNALHKYEATFKKHLKKGILKQDQYDILLPKNGKTLQKNMDITLISYLLRTCCNLNARATGWNKEPNITDNSDEANFVRLRLIRNKKQHNGPIEMTHNDFKAFETEISQPLLALGCQQNDITNALTCEIDNDLNARYSQQKTRANQATIRANQETTKANQETARADQAEQEKNDLKERADKLESFKENISFKLLPTLPTFIGRDEELSDIHKKLSNTTSNQQGVVIHGMGGVGKSELARAYANKNNNHYNNNVLWINGESISSIEKSFHELAELLGLSIKQKLKDGISGEFISNEVIVQRVYRFYGNHECLFIIDNVNNKENINSFLPHCNLGMKKTTILITSQFAQWGSYFEHVSLEVFSEEIAFNFLSNKTQEEFDDESSIKELCRLLGYHPLALQHAISYVHVNKGCSYSKYACLFRQQPKQLTEPVFTTFQIALNNILTNNKDDLVLHQLIEFIPLFDGKRIQKAFLMQLFEQDEISVNRTFTTLENLSLINRFGRRESNDDEIITVHSLVQKAILFSINGENNNVKKLQDFFVLLLKRDQSSNRERYSSRHLANIFNILP